MEEYTQDDLKDYLASSDICKTVGSHLVKCYPNRRWYVHSSVQNGYVQILNADISMKYGMTIHIPPSIPELLDKAKKAAGELLERFNLTRGETNNIDAMLLPRDMSGNVANSKSGELDKSIKQNIILE